MLIFPGYQSLDVFGPLDCLNLLSLDHPEMSLSMISAAKEPVSTNAPNSVEGRWYPTFNESILPTHTLDEVSHLDVLLIPGGVGLRATESELKPYVDFIARIAPQCQHIVTVCTGAALLARAGALDGKRATTNKRAWHFTAWGPKTHWIAKARWVRDGNVWTAAGVSAGIDTTLAWIGSTYGEEEADTVAQRMEYTRAKDSDADPFSERYGNKDVLPTVLT